MDGAAGSGGVAGEGAVGYGHGPKILDGAALLIPGGVAGEGAVGYGRRSIGTVKDSTAAQAASGFNGSIPRQDAIGHGQCSIVGDAAAGKSIGYDKECVCDGQAG